MKAEGRRLILVHLLLLVLLYEIMFVPNQRTTVRDYDALLVGIAVIEALFLFSLWYCKRRGTLSTGPFDIILAVWLLMIVWELTTSVLNVAHPVLVPCPENVFDTFRKQWSLLLLNVGYSMELLLLGFALGLTAAVLLGLAAVAALTRQIEKNKGRWIGKRKVRLFSVNCPYPARYLTYGLAFAAIVLSLAVGGAAYYAIWVLGIFFFGMAVYYTTKLM